MLKDKMPYNGLPKPRVELLEQLLARSTWPLRLARLFGVPNRTRVRTHRIRVSVGLGSSTLRLGFAADFHTGPSTDPAAITTACEALARANVHALLLGGDFVGARADYFEELAPQLAAIPAPLGKFAVLGNHDYWTGAEQVRAGLRALGCHVLENANVRLPEPFDSVWICGLDDDWTGRPDGRAALRGADGIRVVLMHAPSGLLDLESARFDLALCGHTHGGQVALPGGRALVVPYGELSRRYLRGRFELPGGTLIVTAGIGCSIIPLRTFAPPEVIVCELFSAAQRDYCK